MDCCDGTKVQSKTFFPGNYSTTEVGKLVPINCIYFNRNSKKTDECASATKTYH